MGHKDSEKKKESHKRHREEREEKKSHKEKAKREEVKESTPESAPEENRGEKKTEVTPSVPEKEKSPEPELDEVEQPRKRMRTRSMDMEEEESLYSMRRYRISPETIGILNSHGITELFPIQARTFDAVYDGKDLIGRAPTGQGKTLAFALPIVEKIYKLGLAPPRRSRAPLILVLSPTRELAQQIDEQVHMVAPRLRSICLFGGAPYEPQESALRRGVEFVVGTPGRVLDHLERGNLHLEELKWFVLDEADRMLDMGFNEDVEKVVDYCVKSGGEVSGQRKLPDRIQVLLFSATIPAWVREVMTKYMHPDKVVVDLVTAKEKASVDVQHLVLRCPWERRAKVIADLIQVYCGHDGRAIVFCDMKKSCNELAGEDCLRSIAGVLHGDIPQKTREQTLKDFKEGKFKCLVATDVAARGLDIQGITLVINREPPSTRSGIADVETYIHRSGRTGRAGKKGVCVTLSTGLQQEAVLQTIEKAVGNAFTRIGAPQPSDLLKAKAANLLEQFDNIDAQMVEKMLPLAEEVCQKQADAKEAIARCLCLAVGAIGKMQSRSILTSQDGYKTFEYHSLNQFRSPSYVWGALRRYFPEDVVGDIKAITMTKDEMGAVFDVADKDVKAFEDFIAEHGERSQFAVCTSLPELKDRDLSQMRGKGGFSGGRNDRNNRRGGFGGGRGGRGGFGGGRGGFNGGNRGFRSDGGFKKY